MRNMCIYIYIYRSEGLALTGYDIPGCVEDGAWSSLDALGKFFRRRRRRRPPGFEKGAVIGLITTSALPGCADRSVSSSKYRRPEFYGKSS